MSTESIVNRVSQFVVRVQTRQGYGTGFIFWKNQEICAIATAGHIIESATEPEWETPIRITQSNGKLVHVYPHDRWVVPRINDLDAAVIVVRNNALDIPRDLVPLYEGSPEITIGSRIGWLGYPALVDANILRPSFFSGVISNIFPDPVNQYVIDGVSIHGVSGGPVFCLPSEGSNTFIIGLITSYHVNRVPVGQNVEAWPGLLVSQSVSVYKPIIQNFDSIEQAKQGEKP